MLHLIILLCACSGGTKGDDGANHTGGADDTGGDDTATSSCDFTGTWSSQLADTQEDVTVTFIRGSDMTISDLGDRNQRISSWSEGPGGVGISITEISVTGDYWLPCGAERPALYLSTFSEDCNTETLELYDDYCDYRAAALNGMVLTR